MRATARTATIVVALTAATLALGARADSEPVVGHSATTRKLEAMPRPVGARKVVTIYDFRSSVTEIPAHGATDMFTTALIKSGAFAVAERNRLGDGVLQERSLAASGISTGEQNRKVVAADYIFEGTISEMTQVADQSGNGLNIGGMSMTSSRSADEIAIDVRIVDASTGLVLDSVDVHKRIESTQSGVANVGGLIGSVAALGGHSLPIQVDANTQSGHHEGVDGALRACIEAAVYELVQRYGRD